MKRFLPLLLISLFFISKESKADCNPAFTATVQGATVQVQATNNGPHLFHSWRFGYTWGAGPNTSYTFIVPGTYTIMHKVVDSLGQCEDSASQTVTVSFQPNCTAAFTAVRDPLQLNRYTFNSTSTTNAGTINLYNWKFNGIVIATITPSIEYILPIGTSNVCLTIFSTSGCYSSVCQTITITDTTTCNWSASFTAIASASNPRQISFVPTPSLNRMRFNWNFGDGFTSTQKTPVHTYNYPGTYNVRLSIWDTTTGCHDTTVHQLQVHGSPADSCTVSFTYTADPSESNQLAFTATSNQTITSQLWWINNLSDPYDSVFLSTNNPTYTFTDTGYYQVCLYITTNTGCSRSYCSYIYINNIGGRLAGTIPSFPNPATSSVNFSLSLSQPNMIGITVYNSMGNAVYGLQKQGASGTNNISIPVQQLRPGQYYIEINYGGQRKRSLFQKM